MPNILIMWACFCEETDCRTGTCRCLGWWVHHQPSGIRAFERDSAADLQSEVDGEQEWHVRRGSSHAALEQHVRKENARRPFGLAFRMRGCWHLSNQHFRGGDLPDVDALRLRWAIHVVERWVQLGKNYYPSRLVQQRAVHWRRQLYAWNSAATKVAGKQQRCGNARVYRGKQRRG